MRVVGLSLRLLPAREKKWKAPDRAPHTGLVSRGFMGDGRDTAYAALFLASDEARFITGTEIIVDGGMVARCD